jgi:hypothetical protein
MKETSQVWQKVFADERRNGHSLQQLADKLLIPSEELVKLVFGLVTVGVPSNTTAPSGPTSSRATLRVVK